MTRIKSDLATSAVQAARINRNLAKSTAPAAGVNRNLATTAVQMTRINSDLATTAALAARIKSDLATPDLQSTVPVSQQQAVSGAEQMEMELEVPSAPIADIQANAASDKD
jgi:multidrug efflux pump subunit AcrA (membrane-fusion protein)